MKRMSIITFYVLLALSSIATHAITILEQEEVKPTTFLFAHGVQGSSKNADWYTPEHPNNKSGWGIINGPVYAFDFPDVGKGKGAVKYGKVNIGQDADIDALVSEYNKILETPAFRNPEEGIVIVGVSRGAITALNAAGTRELPRLRALVIEGAADTPANAIKGFARQFAWQKLGKFLGYLGYSINAIPQSILDYVTTKFTSYDPHGITPLKAVASIPKELPILLVHTFEDDVASINGARVLYYILRATGHPHVHLLELFQGQHAKYNLGFNADIYQNVVNAFYKRYGIPFNSKLAQEGQAYFNGTQPSLQEVEAKIKQQGASYWAEVQEALSNKKNLASQVRAHKDEL